MKTIPDSIKKKIQRVLDTVKHDDLCIEYIDRDTIITRWSEALESCDTDTLDSIIEEQAVSELKNSKDFFIHNLFGRIGYVYYVNLSVQLQQCRLYLLPS